MRRYAFYFKLSREISLENCIHYNIHQYTYRQPPDHTGLQSSQKTRTAHRDRGMSPRQQDDCAAAVCSFRHTTQGEARQRYATLCDAMRRYASYFKLSREFSLENCIHYNILPNCCC